MIVGAAILVEFVELVLGEVADLERGRARHRAVFGRQTAGQELHQRRFAVAVGAEQRDAIVIVDAQRQPGQDRMAGLVADCDVVGGDDRRRQQLVRRRDVNRAHFVGHQCVDRLHLGQHLDARLRLSRLAGLGAEAVDEGLQMLALRVLLLDHLLVEHHALATQAFEVGIAAAIERQLLGLQRQDLIDGVVQQVAVVADDHHGVGIARQMILQPQRAFEIEIVGRLVEQQQIGLGEQSRRQRHAHAPAAGEFRTGPRLIGGGKAEAGEDRRGTRRRGVRAHIGEPGLDFGDAVRIVGGLGLGQQRVALDVGLEHHLEQALRTVRGFLRQPPDAPARRQFHAAVLGRDVTGDDVEQRGLAGAVAADQSDAGARRNACAGALQQRTAGNANGEIVDDKHYAPFGRAWRTTQPLAPRLQAGPCRR